MHRNLVKLILISAVAAICIPAAAQAGDAAAGKAIFDMNCMSCHGETGTGDGPLASALNPKPRDFSVGAFAFDTDDDGTPGTDTDLKNVIQKGAAAYKGPDGKNGSPLMAPWPALSDGDVDNLVAYIRSLKK